MLFSLKDIKNAKSHSRNYKITTRNAMDPPIFIKYRNLQDS